MFYFMARIFLYLATNLAVVVVAGIILNILGVSSYMQGSRFSTSSLLVFCAVFGFVGSFISLMLSKTMAKRSMLVQIITTPQTRQEQWLVQTVAMLSQKAGIKMPEVGIFPMDAANAFATGWNKNDALVAISHGMLQRFSESEIEAVLGHEIGHVANGDMVTLTLIQGIVNTFVLFFARIIGNFVDKVVLKNDKENGHGIGFWVTTIVAEIALGFLASMIVMWFSRKREYRADYAGATLVSPSAMIAALQHIQHESNQNQNLPDSFQAFGISGNLTSGLQSLLSSHPPLASRIEALRQLN